MKKCPKCGVENRAVALFCRHCGVFFELEVFPKTIQINLWTAIVVAVLLGIIIYLSVSSRGGPDNRGPSAEVIASYPERYKKAAVDYRKAAQRYQDRNCADNASFCNAMADYFDCLVKNNESGSQNVCVRPAGRIAVCH